MKSSNDPCLECGKPTAFLWTLTDGNTVLVGVDRLSSEDGWLCGNCAGYECDGCGKKIYLDEDVSVTDTNGDYLKYHYECLTPELKALAIEQDEVEV